MKFGVHLPQVGPTANRDNVLAVARRADELGLASVWVGDHLAFPAASASPYPYSRDGEFPVGRDAAFLEALTTLSVVAGATDRVAVGASVVVTPLRDTVTVARQVATLAHLASGRVILGVGAGWLREEFEVLGRSFAGRGRYLDDQLVALHGLWTEQPYAHDGPEVQFPAVYVEPRPDPLPEVWVGGNGALALQRAGRLGDAWHAAGAADAKTLHDSMAIVREAAADVGRDPASVVLTARTGVAPGADGFASLERRLERLAAAGCVEVVVSPAVEDIDEQLALFEQIASLGDRW